MYKGVYERNDGMYLSNETIEMIGRNVVKIVKAYKRYVVVLFVIFVIGMGAMGCSSLQYSFARRQYISSQIEDYRYTVDSNVLWRQAYALLLESGYRVVSVNPYRMETDWRWTSEKDARRYFVTRTENMDGTTSIRFMYEEHTEGFSNISSGRDYYDMEYTLLRRMEHDSWAQIEEAANAYASSQVQD